MAGALPMRSHAPISKFLPDVISADMLRAIALQGIDAAHRAGASYADIRIADIHTVQMDWGNLITSPTPRSEVTFSHAYGLRAYANGAWSFVFGVDPSSDSIVEAARRAVETARGVAKIGRSHTAMIPVPIVQGEWTTPVQIDPFAVSPDAYAQLLGAFLDANARVRDGVIPLARLAWSRETRVFASTDGSLMTQHFMRAMPRVDIAGERPLMESAVVIPLPGFTAASGGFERVIGPQWQEQIKEATEEVVRLASYPEGYAEIGRYAAILDGATVGILLGHVMTALEMTRVLGYEANAAGTSFLSPPGAMLGAPIFSPQLYVKTNRALPHYHAARWDDEGVATEPFPLIERGRLVNYFVDRRTADTSEQANRAYKVHGTAVASDPSAMPEACALHINVEPDTLGPTLPTLIKELRDGVFVQGIAGSGFESFADQQLSTGWFLPATLYEVKRGRITRRLRQSYLQYRTKPLWQTLTAVGNVGTMQASVRSSYRGETWARVIHTARAPAIQVPQVDIIPFGRVNA